PPVGRAPPHAHPPPPLLPRPRPAGVADSGQREDLLRTPATGTDPDQPGTRGVVLDLVAAGGVVGARLVHHQNLAVAASRHAGRLPGAGYPGDVVELDRRDQPFPVLRAHPRLP